MKLKIWIGSILFVIFFFSLTFLSYAQSNFEGEVTFKVTDDDGSTQTMNYFVKGDKIRFDTKEEGQGGQIIWDTATRQFMVVMPDQKMYMVMKAPDSKMDIPESIDKNTKFTKTGETKKILGYTAEKFLYKDNEDQGEVWLTQELGSFKLFNNPMQKGENMPQWQKDFNAAGYFPLEVTENGKKVFEIIGINKKSLDASMFEAPSDYKKMEMPMMQQ
jgi:hypothetical protein